MADANLQGVKAVSGVRMDSLPGHLVYHSQDLFEKGREIIIIHGQSRYRLQITKAGKLILNK